MSEPTNAEIVLGLRDWVWGAHELPGDAQLLTDAADRLEEAEARIARFRWNIDTDGDDLLICDGEHEKSQHCEEHEQRWVEVDRLDAANATIKNQKAALDAANFVVVALEALPFEAIAPSHMSMFKEALSLADKGD